MPPNSEGFRGLRFWNTESTPFRHAHELVGKAVATRTPLDQLDLTAIDPAYGPNAKDVFSLETALAARTNPGAPSIANVKSEIDGWKSVLELKILPKIS